MYQETYRSPGKSRAIREKGRDDGLCGLEFLKYVLYVFNVIFWLSGCGFIAVGLWTLFEKHEYVTLLTSETYVMTTYLLLGIGAIVIVVGIIGCCGAAKENRPCLILFGIFLFLIFLLEAAVGVMAYMYEAVIHQELMRGLNRTMLNNYKIDKAKTLAIDNMQQSFKCCGAGAYSDWHYSRWLLGSPDVNNSVPDSCCLTMSMYCAVREHPSNIYTKGCAFQLEMYLKEHLIIMGAVGLGVCCLQLFGVVFSCCFAKKIKDFAKRQTTLNWIG